MQTQHEWIADRVVTRDGRVVPIRATARRPHWADLPASAREVIAFRLGAEIISASSTGIGFTPGFASRLDLADGRRVFVKAASNADDARHGWGLPEAYREEIRKRRALPSDLPAPALLWTVDEEIAGVRWVILCSVRRRCASASTLAIGRTAPSHRRLGPTRTVTRGGTRGA